MPGSLLPAIIGGASALFGGAVDAFSTGVQNRRSREFSREMYERTKQDNLAFWHLQNQYNSPAAQMQRFKDAGLNPALIYGQGSSGQAGQIPTPDVQNVQFRTPEWGNAISSAGLTYMNAIYDFDIKQAQTDLLKAQAANVVEETLLRAAQADETRTQEEQRRFDLNRAKDLRDIDFGYRKEQLRQLRVSTDLSIQRAALDAARTASSVQEAAQRIKESVERTKNTILERRRITSAIDLMQKSGELRQMDIDLRKQGINPNDPMWARMVGKLLENLISEPGKESKSIWDYLFR